MDFNKGMASGAGSADRLLARQGSVYSLTFDEFQNTLGKEFGSMNMDELLKNIWTAEETQAMATTMGGGVTSAEAMLAGGGIQRQGSLTLPRTLSQKTVDEVWRDLIRENTASTSGPSVAAMAAAAVESKPQRQQTLGEMTLEEFLVRAGVVREDAINNGNGNINNNHPSNSSDKGLFYNNFMGGNASNAPPPMGNSNNATVMPMPLRSYVAGGMVGMGDPVVSISNGVMGPGGVVTVGPVGSSPDGGALGKANNGEVGSISPAVPYGLGAGGMRGVKKGGAVEKVVERRQRRMIKNRESAARSRARKQAYTMELEAEVAKLKEQNQELQNKQTAIEREKNEVMEMLNHQHGPKKRCLRRTQTGPW